MRELRVSFVQTLMELAKRDKDIFLLNDDTGFNLFEEFGKRFPFQYINCGITEQTYMGIAAGLARSEKKPYVYGIIPFAIMRCYEQLRDDVCYHNANVKIVAVGGFQYYKFLGFTHNIEKDEDIKILRHLPNIKIHIPKTSEEVRKIIQAEYKRKGPAYIRL
jgi:transketolase